jgi:probable HAF family extracellular repeat protein
VIIITGGTPAYPVSINNAGWVTGYATSPGGIEDFGFEWSGSGNARPIQIPGSTSTTATAISNSGKIFGSYEKAGTTYNFALKNGVSKQLNIPASSAQVFGVNPGGTALVGIYYSGMQFGFLYQNLVLQTLQFPGATDTWASAINSTGEVVGYFAVNNGAAHGFTWTPPAPIERKQLTQQH